MCFLTGRAFAFLINKLYTLCKRICLEDRGWGTPRSLLHHFWEDVLLSKHIIRLLLFYHLIPLCTKFRKSMLLSGMPNARSTHILRHLVTLWYRVLFRVLFRAIAIEGKRIFILLHRGGRQGRFGGLQCSKLSKPTVSLLHIREWGKLFLDWAVQEVFRLTWFRGCQEIWIPLVVEHIVTGNLDVTDPTICLKKGLTKMRIVWWR